MKIKNIRFVVEYEPYRIDNIFNQPQSGKVSEEEWKDEQKY